MGDDPMTTDDDKPEIEEQTAVSPTQDGDRVAESVPPDGDSPSDKDSDSPPDAENDRAGDAVTGRRFRRSDRATGTTTARREVTLSVRSLATGTAAVVLAGGARRGAGGLRLP